MPGLTRRALVAAAIGAPLLASGRVCAAPPFRFGLTPVLLDSDIALLDQMQVYLEEALGSPVDLVKRRTYQEITALLLSGELDAAWICGFPFVQHWDRLALVVVPLYHQQPLYQSYLIVPRDREVGAWEQLRGDIHAFSDPDSNSGHLVTWALLAEAGETPQSFFRETIYTYGHRNVVRAVASGLAQSGSVDGYVWDVISNREPSLAERTRVLRVSELLGFPPIACLAGNQGSAKVQALSVALQAAGKSESGRKLLTMLELDGFAVEDRSLFNAIAAKYELVKGQPT
ncbi:MAG TPA: PhnD/SsuA/transferrin family substrate-binding protein [Dongiaceae bacterium]|nr:PhnD/SsuA/transferrin family substrate-binding protein [Dongiaceae bacterium]